MYICINIRLAEEVVHMMLVTQYLDVLKEFAQRQYFSFSKKLKYALIFSICIIFPPCNRHDFSIVSIQGL